MIEPGAEVQPSNSAGDQPASEDLVVHITTDINSFGVFRKYVTVPFHNPCDDMFADIPIAPAPPQSQRFGSDLAVAPPTTHCDLPISSKTQSGDMILGWAALTSGNTPAAINNLVRNAILHRDFNPSELQDFNAVTEIRRFDKKHYPKPGSALKAGNGWKEGSAIRVPCTGVKQRENEAPEFVVKGILYRDVVEVITAELEDPDGFSGVHTTPYEEWWEPGSDEELVRVYSEVYNSDAMLQADAEMREGLAHQLGDDLETFLVSALLYSDSTHLASFGTASLWPMYLSLGNVSKYVRCKPTSFSAHHVAYIPTVFQSSFLYP